MYDSPPWKFRNVSYKMISPFSAGHRLFLPFRNKLWSETEQLARSLYSCLPLCCYWSTYNHSWEAVVCFRLGVIKRVIEWGLRRKEVNVKQTQPGQAGDFMSAAWVSLLWQFSFYRFIQTVAPAGNHPVGRHKVWPSEITFRTPKSGPSTYCKQWSLSTTRR